MSFDARAFRRTVGCFATGVTVVTVEVDGAVRGMTANSFTSVSLDPPLVLFCVLKTSHMGVLMRSTPRFAVNILRDDQRDLSTFFAGFWKGDSPPPYSFLDWEGGPLLEGCAAALGCTVETIYEGGDHWIVVGRVLALYQGEEPSELLLFCKGQYRKLPT